MIEVPPNVTDFISFYALYDDTIRLENNNSLSESRGQKKVRLYTWSKDMYLRKPFKACWFVSARIMTF